jgi:molecular chaperone GrpE
MSEEETEPRVEQRPDPCLEQLQRERADFLNYKHRVDRDRIEDRERARQDLLRQLLPALDDLDRALAHMPADLENHPWAQGVVLSRERFLETLRQLGIERIGNQGERFDPSLHEAVVYHEEPTATEQHIRSVLRPGYRLGAQLLRPAQVVVAGPPRILRQPQDRQAQDRQAQNERTGGYPHPDAQHRRHNDHGQSHRH